MPRKFLIGTCVKTGAGHFYIKSNTTRLHIPTKRILRSWNFGNIVKAQESDLKNCWVAGRLGFRAGTVIQNWADSKMYVIENNRRRQIIDPDSLEDYGLDLTKMILVSQAETDMHEEGEPL
jgi:hypothetical protein